MPKVTFLRVLIIAFVSTLAVFVLQGLAIQSELHHVAEIKPINVKSLTGEYTQVDRPAEFHGQQVASVELPEESFSQVLGDSDALKRIEVDLAYQMLYAYEGDRLVYNFLISSGKWGRTPTGTFKIWGKFRYTKMEGGSKAFNTYYYLPNVPYVMFFSNDEIAASRGFSLHGTY